MLYKYFRENKKIIDMIFFDYNIIKNIKKTTQFKLRDEYFGYKKQ